MLFIDWKPITETDSMSDISRYIRAQKRTHAAALRELKRGYKSSHWSWWEIPQIIGLGMTSTSREYAIKDLNEAKDYLANETLRTHLLELCDALLSLDTDEKTLRILKNQESR